MDITIQLIFWAGLLFCIKHFVCDGLLQTDYQYANKGKWGHPGGLIHSGLHGLFTFPAFVLPFIFAGVDKPLWFICAFGVIAMLADAMIHYLIDLTKIQVTDKYAWSAMGKGTSKIDKEARKALLIYNNKYFWAIMADQCMHFMTYIMLLCFMLAIVHHTPQVVG